MKDLQRQKLLEAIVFFAKNTKWCGSIKLFKLLFFLDMLNFRETGRSVTGLTYTALPMGPVPTTLLTEFKSPRADLADKVTIVYPASDDSEAQSKRTQITPKVSPEIRFLTVREARIAEELAEIFYEATAQDMSDVSHAKNGPWERAKDRSPGAWKGVIDYLDALSPTLKMGSGKARSRQELLQRAADFEEARKLFG